ncbi:MULTISPECIES: phage tail tape measure protein [unclassified Streptococcus]|uniref:phage tail tape measure protein n=1 Tax=unclassified Streptococcus TaxID=2608887 RepID=UPI001563B7C2|nr:MULTISPECIES: phage tail tape measure protein [unclassified Streptococcus]
MAGNIKGIKIEIDGDTQPLQKALKGVNQESANATKELKQIDKALKFDTGNVTLLTQKQEVLQKQVGTTREKLETLRQAQSQVEEQFKKGDIGADQYRAFQREVEVTQNVLKGYEGKLASVNQALEGNGNATKNNQTQLKELQNEQKLLASESEKVVSSFKLQESQMGANASEADKLALAEKKIGAQSEIVASQIENLEKQLSLTKEQYGENSAEANKMEAELNQAKTAYADLGQEMEKLASSGKQAGDSLGETNNLLKAELLNQFSEKLSEISQKLVDFGKNALEAFRQVDEGMDIIVTKTGATGDGLKEMQDIASGIATTIPTDFSKAGEAVGEVNTQFGLTGDALKDASIEMIKFAEINGSDVTNSTISSRKAIEAYGLGVQDLSTVLDSTTYVAQLTGVSVDDLMKKAIEGAPQIKMLGLSFDEGVSLLGQFETSGIDASAALSGMTKAAGSYAKEGKTLKQGLTETIEKIKNTSNETEAMGLAMEIFGSKKAPQMIDAIKRGAFDFTTFAGTAENAAGTVSTTFEDTLDPIDKFTTAQNSVTLAMSELGASIAEVLAPVFEMLGNIVKQVAEWFSGLPGPIKEFIVIIGAVVTAVGVLAPIFFSLQAIFTTSIGAMITAALPIIGIVAGIVAAISAVVIVLKYLWETNEGFRNAVTAVWEAISSVINTVVGEISNFIMSIFGTVVTWWTENQELIRSITDAVWTGISAIISAVMTVLGPLIEGGWNTIQTITSTVWEVIKTVVETAINVVLGIIKAVMQILTGDWSGAWETIKSVGETIWNGIASVIGTIFNGIAQVLSNIWNTISTVASNVWNGIKSTLSGIFDGISSSVSSVFNGIRDTISNIWNGIKSTASSVWNGIKDTIGNAINGAKDLVGRAIEAIKGFFNFEFRWPHIPLPHFSISGSLNPVDWLSNGLPSIGVEWYAKGGILTKPTVFGSNGNSLMVGGEAGNEAVLPLNERTLGAIGRGIAQTMGGLSPVINVSISGNNISEEMDINRIADVVAQKIADELQRKTQLRGGIA